jgi:hypothetical protein
VGGGRDWKGEVTCGMGSKRGEGFCPEMEVTEIILAKVSRLFQLSSHSLAFLSRL